MIESYFGKIPAHPICNNCDTRDQWRADPDVVLGWICAVCGGGITRSRNEGEPEPRDLIGLVRLVLENRTLDPVLAHEAMMVEIQQLPSAEAAYAGCFLGDSEDD